MRKFGSLLQNCPILSKRSAIWILSCLILILQDVNLYARAVVAEEKHSSSPLQREFIRLQGQMGGKPNKPEHVEALKKLLGQNFLLEDVVRYQLAQWAFSQNDHDLALEYVAPLSQQNLNQVFRNKVDLLISQALISKVRVSLSGNPPTQLKVAQRKQQEQDIDRAKKLLLSLERRMRGAQDLPRILWSLAWISSFQGETAAACRYSQSVLIRFPLFEETMAWGFPWKDAEGKDLRLAGRRYQCPWSFEDYSRRLRNLQLANQNEKAVQEVAALNKAKVFSPLELALLQAQLWVQNGEMAEAKEALKLKLEKFKDDTRLLNLLAQASARAGLPLQAVHYYRRILEIDPKGKQGESALFQSAFTSYIYQNYDLALKYFEEFLQKFPRSSQRNEVRWLLGWIRYLRKDYDLAISHLTELQSAFTRRFETQAEARRIAYWRAMAQLRQNKLAEAKAIFSRLEQAGNLDFYTLSSRQRLSGLKSVEAAVLPESENSENKTSQLVTQSSSGSEGAEFAASGSQGETGSEADVGGLLTEAPNEARDGIASDPNGFTLSEVPVTKSEVERRFQRARLLREAELYNEAYAELAEIHRRHPDRASQRRLVSEFEKVQAYHRSSQLAARFIVSAQGRERVALRQQAFPFAFREEVEAAIAESGVPKEYLYAIMRAESSYRKDVVSPVGALGLMQIMPYTGVKLAALAKQSDYAPAQLLIPQHSVRLGALYLRRLLNQFDGNWALAAAAYNAGPHRVKTWLSQFGHLDLDEFIEHIPFRETRLYVKRVAVNSANYQEIYQLRSLDFAELVVPFHERLRNFTVVTKESWEEIN